MKQGAKIGLKGFESNTATESFLNAALNAKESPLKSHVHRISHRGYWGGAP